MGKEYKKTNRCDLPQKVDTERNVVSGITKVLKGRFKRGTVPALWDGRASQRIAAIIIGDRLAR